ncbi:hypothetical protein ACFX13_033345 [Malus domestica]
MDGFGGGSKSKGASEIAEMEIRADGIWGFSLFVYKEEKKTGNAFGSMGPRPSLPGSQIISETYTCSSGIAAGSREIFS